MNSVASIVYEIIPNQHSTNGHTNPFKEVLPTTYFLYANIAGKFHSAAGDYIIL